MGTTVEELKRLYTKLGGKDKQVSTFNQPGEIINAINELDLPTDYELPKVTTTDAGKVLTVSDAGKWDAETPTKELPAVTSEDAGNILGVDADGKWDKTSGISIEANPEGEATADLTKLGINDDIYGIPKELPAVTSEDNGKVLGVAEGAWGKVDPSGGGGLFTANFSDLTSTIKLTNANISDLRAAADSGKDVLLVSSYYSLRLIRSGSEIVFEGFEYSAGATNHFYYIKAYTSSSSGTSLSQYRKEIAMK